MTIVMRPSCGNQNFGPNGLSAPTLGLCLKFFSSITTDFNIFSALRWAIQDHGPLVCSDYLENIKTYAFLLVNSLCFCITTEPLLVVIVVSTKISWAGSFFLYGLIYLRSYSDRMSKDRSGSGWGTWFTFCIPFIFRCILPPKYLAIWKAVCLWHKIEFSNIAEICDFSSKTQFYGLLKWCNSECLANF